MPDGKGRTTKKRIAAPANLTVEGELLDVGLPAPLPGITYVISIMRYKVLRVVQGEYSYPYIFVGHDVPDLQSPQFQVSVHHRLQLTRKFPEHSSILNKFEDESRSVGVFFCVSFEVMHESS